MFALEIDFQDGISSSETVLVRRASAIIGSSDDAHILIEGSASNAAEFCVTRGPGNSFWCSPRYLDPKSSYSFEEGLYTGNVELSLGDVLTRITSLDVDLLIAPDESPDEAGVRVLRKAFSNRYPDFPAVSVEGELPSFISFIPSDFLIIGRSRSCHVRLEAADISDEHARVGFDENGFWIEDLNSSSGIYIDGKLITERKTISSEQEIILGQSSHIHLIEDRQAVKTLQESQKSQQKRPAPTKSFPCLIAVSPNVRPDRFELQVGDDIQIGRDPANDIWINSPIVSRIHARVMYDGQKLSMVDLSTNGVWYNAEQVEQGVAIELQHAFGIINFAHDIKLALCFNLDEEASFLAGEIKGESTVELSGQNSPPSEQSLDLGESDEPVDFFKTVQTSSIQAEEPLITDESGLNPKDLEPIEGEDRSQYIESSRGGTFFEPNMLSSSIAKRSKEVLPKRGSLNRLFIGLVAFFSVMAVVAAFIFFLGNEIFN